MAAPKKVLLIFSGTEEAYAEEITAFFMRSGFEPEAAEVSEDGNRQPVRVFLAPDSVADNSAVVLLSDEATADSAWQEAVRNVPDSFRIIPIGGTVQIDYNDPEVLPPRVQEINYIKPDEHYLASLTDSLQTSPSFYSIRNEVMLMVRMWETSGRNQGQLMSSGRKAKKYLRLFEGVHAREKDPSLRAQEDTAITFLRESYANALAVTLRDAWRYIKSALLIAAGAMLLAGFLYVRSVLSRSYYSEILMGVDSSAEDSVTTAVKIAEGITNPFVPETTKARYYTYLSELLEKNWPNTPLGMGQYRWALNDVFPSAQTRYIYTANGKGQMVLWDSWTGEITKRENVSSNPLAAIAVSASGLRAAIDSNGKLYLSSKEGAWTDTEIACPIVWTDAVRLRLSADGKFLLITDSNSLFTWSIENGQLSPLWEKNAETADADLTDEGDVLCIIRRDGIWQAARIGQDGEETCWPLGSELSETCQADVTSNRALFADTDGYLWIWDSKTPEKPVGTGLKLSLPVCLALSDGDWLVFHDRNEGTRVYDFQRKAVLASCLPYAHEVHRLEVKDTLVMGFSGSMIYSEDISVLLPLTGVPGEIIQTFDTSADTNAGKVISSISVANEYLIRLELLLPQQTTVIFDPATHYFVGEAQADLSLEEGLPDTFSYYSGIQVSFTGKPTVVGLIPEEDTFLIGGYDGSFYEICVNDHGGALIASHTQIPTHAAVRAIHRTANGYYLEDSAGNFWFARLGYPSMRSTGNAWLQEIRGKIRMGVSDELLNLVSPQTAEALGLHRFSVPDGKEWE